MPSDLDCLSLFNLITSAVVSLIVVVLLFFQSYSVTTVGHRFKTVQICLISIMQIYLGLKSASHLLASCT